MNKFEHIELLDWLKTNGFERVTDGSWGASLTSDYTHFKKGDKFYRFRNNEYALFIENQANLKRYKESHKDESIEYDENAKCHAENGEWVVDISCKVDEFDRWANSTEHHAVLVKDFINAAI